MFQGGLKVTCFLKDFPGNTFLIFFGKTQQLISFGKTFRFKLNIIALKCACKFKVTQKNISFIQG